MLLVVVYDVLLYDPLLLCTVHFSAVFVKPAFLAYTYAVKNCLIKLHISGAYSVLLEVEIEILIMATEVP